MSKSIHPTIVALCALLMPAAGALAAGGAGFQGIPVAQYEVRAGVSLDQAIQMVEQQYRAKVVRATIGEDNGRRVYVLRLVSEQGRVWTVRVDAASGQVM